MTICFLCREYPPAARVGGIGWAIHDLARALVRLGHRVHVVAPASEAAGTSVDDGVVVHRVRASRWQIPGIAPYAGQTLDRLGWSWAAARALARIHREERVDVVEAPEFAAEGVAANLRRRPPVVVRLHTPLALVRRLNGTPPTWDCRATIRLERAAMARAAAVTAPSRAIVAACIGAGYGAGLGRAEVIPNGVDTEFFRPPPAGRREWADPNGGPLVLFAGRLERRKGVEDLARALPAIAARVPDARFAFVGADTMTAPAGGSWRRYLRDTARAAGIEDTVDLPGSVPREKLPEWYRAATVVVAPSPFEALALVYLEAMASGRPVVGCGAGAFPEVVRDGREGRVVPPGDPQALGDAVVELLEDPEARAAIGRHARRRAVREFAVARVAARTAELYERVAARGRRP